MSNDLISRSALLEDFRNTITEKSDTFDWLNMISRQPTAYDVDKVVEQIEKKLSVVRKEQTNACIKYDGYGTPEQSFRSGQIMQLQECIKIAKAGGVNE